MLVNQETVLLGNKVILVPYMKEHVARYHQWMLDPELRELTASEPLTLEEEHEMQRKWREDEDKLTFIILSRPAGLDLPPLTPSVFASDPGFTSFPMIGDVNMFCKGAPGEDDPECGFEAEVEIMIAEPAFRRQGCAREALELLIDYASSPAHSESPTAKPLPIARSSLVSRISDSNLPSICLFEKLGFQIVKRVEVFHEVEMRWKGLDGAEQV
ncbi:hypothetical protein GLOTRDRAFT_69772 [Gloeophyllum trabeum ATCC 11539]|uniref:N-acetyltransferase domain-containing protein n=1 Tax=Gloeophyllum trabeum (strain ATCC 11539 / FP-39264 / Madison 617) TaxID=670483 RepID=S7S5T5_GLOTA|nr:uncharacterized protein GLOTRDRAFT_69772 [Gloeophyllum trabeum ATCC 11539]EPQ61379.1 hypothetical protein GLOTRDRAFT_69772 [Gloeophyllum trabeum ATCC 11539]